MLNIVDECTRARLAIRVDRKLNSGNVIDALSDLFTLRSVPSLICTNNGPEFVVRINPLPVMHSQSNWTTQAGLITHNAPKTLIEIA